MNLRVERKRAGIRLCVGVLAHLSFNALEKVGIPGELWYSFTSIQVLNSVERENANVRERKWKAVSLQRGDVVDWFLFEWERTTPFRSELLLCEWRYHAVFISLYALRRTGSEQDTV